MIAVVLGATGYTGRVLVRLLQSHPNIDRIVPVSSSSVGSLLADIDPGIGASLAGKLEKQELISLDEAAKLSPGVMFSCLPHLSSANMCEPFYENSVVIDLSADLRTQDAELFQKAYGSPAPRPDLLGKAVYGLCEVYADSIRDADIVAAPGCYPTASLLPLLPVVKEFSLSPGFPIVINAISGISGAGRKALTNLLFCERSENCNAYNPGRVHRHTLEIEKELQKSDSSASILFTPHLAPLRRGMVVTTILKPGRPVNDRLVSECLEDAYGNSPFIRLLKDRLPESAHVRSSNCCEIAFRVEGETLMLFSAIDNLVKGASGQAVQCMNICFGFEETAGLSLHGEV